MGGSGSGRRSRIKHVITEHTCVLTLADLRIAGALSPDTPPLEEEWYVWGGRAIGSMVLFVDTGGDTGIEPFFTVSYRLPWTGSRWKTGNDLFKLVTTRPYFGGTRWWAVCHCGRHVAKLYLPYGATCFRCRHCYQLAYESQRASKDERLRRRARKLRDRLDNIDAVDGRPKWMRKETYALIRVKIARLELKAILAICSQPLPGERLLLGDSLEWAESDVGPYLSP